MSQPMSQTRLLLLIAAFTNPFCLIPCISVAQTAWANMKAGHLNGSVFIVESSGGRSAISDAKVQLQGSSLPKTTVTNQQGHYSFGTVAPGAYMIAVTAPGFIGSASVKVVSGRTLDIPIQLNIEASN